MSRIEKLKKRYGRHNEFPRWGSIVTREQSGNGRHRPMEVYNGTPVLRVGQVTVNGIQIKIAMEKKVEEVFS